MGKQLVWRDAPNVYEVECEGGAWRVEGRYRDGVVEISKASFIQQDELGNVVAVRQVDDVPHYVEHAVYEVALEDYERSIEDGYSGDLGNGGYRLDQLYW